MIPMQRFLAAGIEDLIFVLIALAIVVVKFIGQAQQASKRKEEDRSASSRSSRARPTSADKVQSFLDQISRQVSGDRPASKGLSVGVPTGKSAPQAQAVRKELSPVAAQRVRDRIRRENKPFVGEVAQLGQRHVKANLDRGGLVPTISTKRVRKPIRPVAEPVIHHARIDKAAERLDALLPVDPLKRAVIMRDVLGPCRALAPIDAFRR